MSTITSSDSPGVVGSLVRGVRSVSVTVPAGRNARAAVLADARRIYGLDLSDDDRAKRIRDRAAR